jgi:hypothetical protein
MGGKKVTGGPGGIGRKMEGRKMKRNRRDRKGVRSTLVLRAHGFDFFDSLIGPIRLAVVCRQRNLKFNFGADSCR